MKKLISIFIAFVCLLSSVNFVFAEDTLSEKQIDAISFMNNIGIYQGVTEEKATEALTRAEFAKIVVRVMGGEEFLSQTPRRIFSDVLPEHDAAASIEYLYNRGIMAGYGQAEFKPDSPISLGEAIKVIVSLTGYAEFAEQQGGYPRGYYSVAASNDMIKGVGTGLEEQITYAGAAVMIQNVLESDKYLKVTGYQGSAPLFNREDNKAYMSYALGIYQYIGILEAYDNTSLYNARDEYKEGMVKIDGELLDASGVDVSKYLGMRIKVYYKADDTGYRIMHAVPDKNTKMIEVKDDDIDEGTTKTRFQYNEKNSLRNAKISDDAIFIYNGKRLDIVADTDLIVRNGYVRLVSNNSGSTYDVVVIKNYETFIVDKAVATDSILNFKYGRGSLDLGEEGVIKTVYWLEGEKADFSGISSGSVVSIAMSKNTVGDLFAEVMISNNKITGVAKSVYDNDYRRCVELDDESVYEFTDEYEERLEAGESNTYEPSVGNEGEFYIDYFNRVAGYKISAGSKDYAYVVKCWYDKDAEDGEMRVFTKDGNFETYKLTDKVTVNNVKTDPDKIPEMLKASNPDADPNKRTVNQLIICKASEDGVVKKIQIAENKTSEKYYVASDEEFVLHAHPSRVDTDDTGKQTYAYPGIRFYKDMGYQYPFSFMSGKTIHFMIPTDKTNEKAYKVATKLSSTDVSVPGPVFAYDAGLGGALGAVVSNTEKSGKFGTPVIVDSVAKAVDEEGDVCTLIKFIGGQSVYADDDVNYSQPGDNWSSYADYSNTRIEDLKRGDVIAYTTQNEKVLDLFVIVRVNDIGELRTDGQSIAESGNMIADVVSVSENGRTAMVYYYDNHEKRYFYQTMLVNSTTYRYDSSDGKVYNSSASDLQPGDRVLINSFWWSPKLIVIFR